MKRTESIITRTPGASRLGMAFALATQLALGQGKSDPVATTDDLYNYAILMRVATMDQIAQKIDAAGRGPKAVQAARDYAKQQTGLNDVQQAILVRYANQFYTANMAMFAARGAALQANNQALAGQTERNFHTASKALIEALKKDLGPAGWGTLTSTLKKNGFAPGITNTSSPTPNPNPPTFPNKGGK
jgi:hypothetical protein